MCWARELQGACAAVAWRAIAGWERTQAGLCVCGACTRGRCKGMVVVGSELRLEVSWLCLFKGSGVWGG